MTSPNSKSEQLTGFRVLGIAGCLAVMFSYRPVSQADEKPVEKTPAIEQIKETDSSEEPQAPAPAEMKRRQLKRSGPIFRTASYLEEKTILVPPPLPSLDATPTVGVEEEDIAPATEAEPAFAPHTPKPTAAPKPVVSRKMPQATTKFIEDNWTVTITPGRGAKKNVEASDYNKIYQKIPYRRSEYLANPSYRHEATMEILFGELRPTVNHNTKSPQVIRNPRPQLYQDNQFLSNDYWRYHPPALRYFNRYLPLQF